MNENKIELQNLIVRAIERFCGQEGIPMERRIQAFRPMEFIMQMSEYDRDACLDIRKEVTRLVGEWIHKEYESDPELAREWKHSTFGNLPELELGAFIEQTYKEYSVEMERVREMYEKRGGEKKIK